STMASARRVRWGIRSTALMAAVVLGAIMTSVMRAATPTPRPEHPRPDAYRPDWLSLNGDWQFEVDANADGESRGLTSGKELKSRITVPFPPESRLSGVGETAYMRDVWYRRLVEVPASLRGKRVLLHFGAVDYKAWVYVNGS